MGRKVEIKLTGASLEQNFIRINNYPEEHLNRISPNSWGYVFYNIDLNNNGLEYLEFDFRSEGAAGDTPALTIIIDGKTPHYTYNTRPYNNEGKLWINQRINL